jgi:transcriptional regulator with XRE-family HTH domain
MAEIFPSMQQMIRVGGTELEDGIAALTALVERARALNISVLRLCERAGVSQSTVWRRLKGGGDIHIGKFSRDLTKLRAALAQEERRLAALLQPRAAE